MKRRKTLVALATVLYGAIGAWLVFVTAVRSPETDDLPSWVGASLRGAVLVVYAVGVFLLRRAATGDRPRRAILVPLLFPPAALAVVILALVTLGGRF